MSKQRYIMLILILLVLSGVLYNSWPLGYILNNPTAHNGLASDLEQAGQPYYWVFMGGDILTGFVLVAAVILSWCKLFLRAPHRGLWLSIGIGLLLFGVFTAGASLVPAHCEIGKTLTCNSHNSLSIGLDAVMSAIAALGLFVSLVCATALAIRAQLHVSIRQFMEVAISLWSISGLLFIYYAVTKGHAHDAQLIQQVFLVFCGLALVAIGSTMSSFMRQVLARKAH